MDAAPVRARLTPVFIPAPVADWADAALARLAALAPAGALDGITGAQLLTERAAISGYVSRGAISPGGSCRLLDAADGGIALNLARDDDWELLPAWLEQAVARDWEAVAEVVRSRLARPLVERGREIGLAVAVDEAPVAGMARSHNRSGTVRATPPLETSRVGARNVGAANAGAGHARDRPRVIDLSSLWAGPLCGYLLQRLGAEVIKVESLRRPDGARRGPALFFDLLNAGKASVALDFASAEGRAQLAALIESADIVIEASRPRALRQLGIDAAALCAHRPGLVWASITAYGRGPHTGHWIGYGDDVGVAAGLSAVVRAATGERRIVGDAIADPLTGIHAALTAWQAWRAGEGGLLDLAMHDVVQHCITEKWGQVYFPGPLPDPKIHLAPFSEAKGGQAPFPRRPDGSARPMGADTEAVLGGRYSSSCVRQRTGPLARLAQAQEEHS